MTRSGGASPLLVIIALVAVAGLLWWLNRASADLERQAAPVLADSAAATVEFQPGTLATNPATAVGQTGWLRAVTVEKRLGRGAFAVTLDSTHAFPILLSSDLISGGSEVYGNDKVSVYGRMFTLNDSIRSEWVRQDAVEQANADAIPHTSSFLLADSLSVGS